MIATHFGTLCTFILPYSAQSFDESVIFSATALMSSSILEAPTILVTSVVLNSTLALPNVQ